MRVIVAILSLILAGTASPAMADPYPDEPQLAPEGCAATDPGTPTCTYTATANGGIGGYAPAAGDWTVTIKRKGSKPLVVRAGGGYQTYQCGIIRPGDDVTAAARPGAGVTVGNPGICF